MTKEELIKRLDPETYGSFCLLLAHGMSDAEAAKELYDQGLLCYWERDILMGE